MPRSSSSPLGDHVCESSGSSQPGASSELRFGKAHEVVDEDGPMSIIVRLL